MTSKNPAIDNYLSEGCGRCPLGGTPDCKVHSWQKELKLLRTILLGCGLTEELKWKAPCYTLDGKNVCMIGALKNCATISFFKGALLNDPQGLLEKPGENCQAARVIRFTSAQTVRDLTPVLKDFICQAMKVEHEGRKVDLKAKNELILPEELENRLRTDPQLQSAWDSLTPGRQRGYVLHFSAAKQSKTRESRIEKCVPAILNGRGLHD